MDTASDSAASDSTASDSTVLVSTPYGDVLGYPVAADVSPIVAWRGIPYATPPVGKLRFRAPRPLQPWSGVLDGLEFGAMAPQGRDSPVPIDPSLSISEDCLTLNLWTPGLDSRPRPVIVFVHGGGLTAGSSSTRMLNGARLAARGDVVVASFNYRLGALGTLYAPDRLGADPVPGALWDPQPGLHPASAAPPEGCDRSLPQGCGCTGAGR